MKQKCKEKIFEQTTSAWGRGTEAKNNSNHVIKYFPRKITDIGRGGRGRGEFQQTISAWGEGQRRKTKLIT